MDKEIKVYQKKKKFSVVWTTRDDEGVKKNK
jgi:hypothetical protein